MLALCSLLAVLVVPFILLCMLIFAKRKGLINSLVTTSFWQRNLAYFYVDYPPHSYYWDFVRMLKRILLVILFTIYAGDDAFKGVLALIIIVCYYAFQLKIGPYENRAVRNIDLMSAFA